MVHARNAETPAARTDPRFLPVVKAMRPIVDKATIRPAVEGACVTANSCYTLKPPEFRCNNQPLMPDRLGVSPDVVAAE